MKNVGENIGSASDATKELIVNMTNFMKLAADSVVNKVAKTEVPLSWKRFSSMWLMSQG